MSEKKDGGEGHTPTPWTLDEVPTECGRAFRIGSGEMLKAGKGCCIIYDDFRAPGTVNQRSANAHLIVTAVNERSALLRCEEALRVAREWLKKDCRPDADFASQGHNWNMSDEDRSRGLALIAAVDAALALLDEARHGK